MHMPAGAAPIPTDAGTATVPRADGPLYAYLLVVSGALFPLRFIPINYEWLSLAATVLFVMWQVKRYGIARLGTHRFSLFVVLTCIVYQLVKVTVIPEAIDRIQLMRGLYGLVILYLGIAAMAIGPVPSERILTIASNVMALLVVLVLASVATGVRMYAAGFLPELGDEDIRDSIASGNYRIITYYSAFVVFLLFANMLRFFRDKSPRDGMIAFGALILVILTGTRSLIAPSLGVAALLTVRHARPTTTAVFLAAIAVAVGAVYLFLPDLFAAYVSRFMVGELFDSWRALEQELVRNAIATAPVFGLAMGTPYSHVMSALAGGTEGYSLNADYDMHNEYLWLMLYFGTVGCAALIGLVFMAVACVRRNARGTPMETAFYAYLLVMMAAMFYSGILLKGYGALWFGIAIGLCARRDAAMVDTAPLERSSPN